MHFRRPVGRITRLLCAILICSVMLLAVHPKLFGLADTIGFAQLVAMRMMTAISCLAIAAVVIIADVKQIRSTRPQYRMKLFALVMAMISLTHITIVLHRETPVDHRGRTDVAVMAFNTEGGRFRVADVLDEVHRSAITVIALPETDEHIASELQDALSRRGHHFQQFSVQTNDSPASATSLLIDTRLGRYRKAPGPFTSLGTVAAEPVGAGPLLIATHASPPIPLFGGMQRWATDVRAAVRFCEGDAIIAGDFNATVDHEASALPPGCSDAATRTGIAATWPAAIPTALGSAIDHVIISEHWRPLRSEVRSLGQSDHRALIAHLQRTP